MTYVLGIHDGHNCGAALCKGGKVVAAVCEERLTRNKNEVGFPTKSIQEVLRIEGISGTDIDDCVFASWFMHEPEHLKNIEPWYRVGSAEQERAEARPEGYKTALLKYTQENRMAQAVELLGISRDRVSFVEHHKAHLAAAYYTSPYSHDTVLGITCDGAGDGVSATVSICSGNSIERIATTDRNSSLGKLYSRMTFLLGMQPWQDEYKVMGLAPYADRHKALGASVSLRRLLGIDGMRFSRNTFLSINYCYEYLERECRNTRFDTLAGAIQFFTEDMLVELVRNAIRETGIHDIVCGGGTFMNVKANMHIANMPEVHSMYVMPSAADESLAIGACLDKWYSKYGYGKPDCTSILSDLYLGGGFTDEDVEEATVTAFISSHTDKQFVYTKYSDITNHVAAVLRDGHIVARCAGRMEWGARALGNRSILAPANDRGIVEKLNRTIKCRDFWMPFAPTIIDDVAEYLFADPKDLHPHFMTYAFETREQNLHRVTAAVHPYDHTMRPQVITKDANPEYYDIVDKAGGVVLNTSFNLHGYPIVYTPEDAIEVFLNSGLEFLALGNYLLTKT